MRLLLLALAPLAAIGLTWSAAAQNTGAALLTQAIAATTSARADYAFDYEIQTTERNWRVRYEPRATPRVRMIQPRLDQLDNDERTSFDRLSQRLDGVSWCADEDIGAAENLRLVREDETSATYSFQPPESMLGAESRRFADRLRGEVTLTKATPDITRIRIYAPASFSPMLMTRVDHVNVVVTCTAAPNGRRYASESVTELRGSAFGNDFDQRSVQRTRNLTAPS